MPLHRATRLPSRPSIRPEKDFSRLLGGCRVAGIDEAGRGPLAGPVVAAAVVWDFDARRPAGLADSKTIPEGKRNRLAAAIRRHALAWGVGLADAGEIDLLNILEATRLASLRALDATRAMLAERLPGETIGGLVTDALELPAAELPTIALIKGDRRSASIAAASILAKTVRDAMMDRYHDEFPEYGWDRNRGYPTEDHRAALDRFGPTVLHRMSFNSVGFFHEHARRSRTCAQLERLLDATPPTADALAALRTCIHDARDRLPPPDLAYLEERVGGIEVPGNTNPK